MRGLLEKVRSGEPVEQEEEEDTVKTSLAALVAEDESDVVVLVQ